MDSEISIECLNNDAPIKVQAANTFFFFFFTKYIGVGACDR